MAADADRLRRAAHHVVVVDGDAVGQPPHADAVGPAGAVAEDLGDPVVVDRAGGVVAGLDADGEAVAARRRDHTRDIVVLDVHVVARIDAERLDLVGEAAGAAGGGHHVATDDAAVALYPDRDPGIAVEAVVLDQLVVALEVHAVEEAADRAVADGDVRA